MSDYRFTKESFLQAVRSKYPAYESWDDDELFNGLTNKYPSYAEQIDPESLETVSGVQERSVSLRDRLTNAADHAETYAKAIPFGLKKAAELLKAELPEGPVLPGTKISSDEDTLSTNTPPPDLAEKGVFRPQVTGDEGWANTRAIAREESPVLSLEAAPEQAPPKAGEFWKKWWRGETVGLDKPGSGLMQLTPVPGWVQRSEAEFAKKRLIEDKYAERAKKVNLDKYVMQEFGLPRSLLFPRASDEDLQQMLAGEARRRDEKILGTDEQIEDFAARVQQGDPDAPWGFLNPANISQMVADQPKFWGMMALGMPAFAPEATIRYQERATPDIKIGDDGEVKVTKDAEMRWDSLWKASAESAFEYWTERSGELIDAAGGAVFKRLPMEKKKLVTKIVRGMRPKGKLADSMRTAREALRKYGKFQSVPAETLEELENGLLQGGFNLDDMRHEDGRPMELPDRLVESAAQWVDGLPDMAASFAVPGAAFSTIGKAGELAQKGKRRRVEKRADRLFDSLGIDGGDTFEKKMETLRDLFGQKAEKKDDGPEADPNAAPRGAAHPVPSATPPAAFDREKETDEGRIARLVSEVPGASDGAPKTQEDWQAISDAHSERGRALKREDFDSDAEYYEARDLARADMYWAMAYSMKADRSPRREEFYRRTARKVEEEAREAVEAARNEEQSKKAESSLEPKAAEPGTYEFHGGPGELRDGKLVRGGKDGGDSGAIFTTADRKFADEFAAHHDGGKVYKVDLGGRKILDLTEDDAREAVRARIGSEYEDVDGEMVTFTKQDFEYLFPDGKAADWATFPNYQGLFAQMGFDGVRGFENTDKGIKSTAIFGGELAATEAEPGEKADVKPAETPGELKRVREPLRRKSVEAGVGDRGELERKVSALWGLAPGQEMEVKEIEAPTHRKGWPSNNRIIIARAPNGLYAYGMEVNVGSSGYLSAPGVWDEPFESEAEAVAAARAEYKRRLRKITKGRGNKPTKAAVKAAKHYGQWIEDLPGETLFDRDELYREREARGERPPWRRHPADVLAVAPGVDVEVIFYDKEDEDPITGAKEKSISGRLERGPDGELLVKGENRTVQVLDELGERDEDFVFLRPVEWADHWGPVRARAATATAAEKAGVEVAESAARMRVKSPADRMDAIVAAARKISATKQLDFESALLEDDEYEDDRTNTEGSEGSGDAADTGAGSDAADDSADRGGSGRRGGRSDLAMVGGSDLPEPRTYVGDGSYDIDAEQRRGVNQALTRFFDYKGRGFLLADGTGVGKTRQLLVLAKEYRERTGKRVLIVSQNVQVFKGSFYKDATSLGFDLDDFDLATYSSLRSRAKDADKTRTPKVMRGIRPGKKPTYSKALREYGLVIFDEAHNLKNEESDKTVIAKDISSHADNVLFATATPMDTVLGSAYFLAEITGVDKYAMGRMLGFEYKLVRDPRSDKNTERAVLRQGMSWDVVLGNVIKLRDEAVRQSGMIRRHYPFLGTFHHESVRYPAEGLEKERRILRYFDALIGRVNKANAKRNLSGQKTMATSIVAEGYKLDYAMDKIRESLAAGRKVIVVGEYVNDSEWFAENPGDWKAEAWDRYIKKPISLPGSLSNLAMRLEAEGIGHAQIYGTGDKADAIETFQGGEVEVALMTPKSGGTGVNLDDTMGDAPRDMVILTTNFAGDQFEQTVGRVSRRNTKTPARVFFPYMNESFSDTRRREIIRKKIEIQQRIQAGEDFDRATFKPGDGILEREAPRGARGHGDLGGYGETASLGGRMDQPSGEDLEKAYNDNETVRVPLELPELVRLAKALLGGKAPVIKKSLRLGHGLALGAFYPDELDARIEMRADLYERVPRDVRRELREQARDMAESSDRTAAEIYKELLAEEREKYDEPADALRTLAHEIGHAVDWSDDKNMSRGNILGRIASFGKYMKRMLGAIPENQADLLTEEDRKELRKQARKAVSDKKDSKAIAQKYKELVAEEVRRRGLVTRDQIMEELLALSMWWKPFDRNADPQFTAYREKPSELYADALSVLLNNPTALKLRAPLFYRSFLAWLNRKPAMKKAYDRIQSDIRDGVHVGDTLAEVRAGFERAEAVRRDVLTAAQATKEYVLQSVKAWFFDQNQVTWDMRHKVLKQGAELDPETDPRYSIEHSLHVGSEHELYMRDMNAKVLRVLKRAGVDWDTFGMYVMFKRILSDRADLPNPWGVPPKRATDSLELLRKQYGDAGVLAMEEARKAFWKLRQSQVIELMDELKVHTKELREHVADNEFYATFSVTEYLGKKYGGVVGSQIHRQIGTHKDIENPATATLLKDLALIASMRRHVAKRDIVNLLRKMPGNEATPAKTRWNGRFREPLRPADSKRGQLVYLENGKVQAWDVPKMISLAWNNETVGMLQGLGAFMRAVTLSPFFRGAYVSWNYGFWFFNLRRDFVKMYRGMPKMKLAQAHKYWWKGIRPAFRSIFADGDELTRDMLKKGEFISMSNPRGVVGDEKALEREMEKYGISQEFLTERERKLAPARRLMGALFTWLPRNWGKIGHAFERVPKIAGRMYLQENRSDLSSQEISHLIRVQAGSPDFLMKALGSPITNNAWLFSDAMKAGWRAEYELYQLSPSEWWMKMGITSFLGKIMAWAMRAGIVGGFFMLRPWGGGDDDEPADDEKKAVTAQELMLAISDYDLANYNCIPFGITKSGKVIYLRIPMDEEARAFGGVLWNMLNKDPRAAGMNVIDYAAGQLPSRYPLFTMVKNWSDYLGGKNPYDDFRGRGLLSDEEFEAQDMRGFKTMLRDTWNTVGGGIIHRFNSDDPRDVKSQLEKVLGLPVMSNFAGRWIRVSDRGIHEMIREEAKMPVRREKAREILDARELTKRFSDAGIDTMHEAVAKMADGSLDKLSDEEMRLVARKYEYIDNGLKRIMSAHLGGAWMEELETAQSKEERLRVLELMVEHTTAKERARQKGRFFISKP